MHLRGTAHGRPQWVLWWERPSSRYRNRSCAHLAFASQNKGDLQTLQKIETEMKQSVADAKARGEAKQGQVEAAKKAVDGEKSGAAGSARGLMAEEEKQQKKEQTGLADAKKKLESDLDVAKKELKKVKQWLLLVPIDWACRVLDSPCVFFFDG